MTELTHIAVPPGAAARAASSYTELVQLVRQGGLMSRRRNRLVVGGGWAEGEAARHVKEQLLGQFTSTGGFLGARGAALSAGCAAGLVDPIR